MCDRYGKQKTKFDFEGLAIKNPTKTHFLYLDFYFIYIRLKLVAFL